MTMQRASSGPDARLEFDKADRIRRALRVSGVSVQEMAEYLGVSRNTVSSWINGHIDPGVQSLRLIAMRTGFPYEWVSEGCTPRDLNPEPTDFGPARVIHLPMRLELAA